MLSQVNIYKYVLAAIALLVCLMGVLLFITPAAIFPDPAWGFSVLHSMEQGGQFNILTQPDQNDLSKNYSEFLSWWSPGQYLIPYLFKSLFKLNLGHASSLTTIICQLVGLAGFYTFFKRTGFNKMISAISVVIIVCQQAFFTPFIFYNGGEILIFAFLGWFLYGCIVIEKPGVKLFAFVLLSGWIGFFCKSSFMWIYMAGLFVMWLRLSEGLKNISAWLIKGLWIGIPALLSIICIYYFYLHKGASPVSDGNGLKLTWQTFAFPLASPLLSGFSIDDMCNGLLEHSDPLIFNNSASIMIVVLLAVLSIPLVVTIFRIVPYRQYAIMLAAFYIVATLFFGYTYLLQLDISYESRHFRPLGLLVLPGVVYMVSRFNGACQIAFSLMIMIIAGFGASFYIKGYQRLKNNNVHGTSGIAQQFIDKPSLDYITALDKANSNAIFVFMSTDLCLEINHNRTITLPPLNNDINIDFDEYLHEGHAGPIYILLPANYAGIRASVIMKSFPGYKGFSLRDLSGDYLLYYATQAR